MRVLKQTVKLIFLLAALLLPGEALAAFPTNDNDWIPIYYGGTYMGDPAGDATPKSANLIGDSTYPAAFTYNDGAYVYYRMRIDGDVSGPGGLDSFGWGIQINTDSDPGTYEYMVMIDGIGTEELRIGQNTIQGSYDDPSDKTEVDVWVELLVAGVNYRVVGADSNFNSDADYFLDFRFPYDTFLAFTGLTEESIVSYFIGTSASTQNLTKDLGAPILSAGFSDEVLTTGRRPTTGAISFVYSNVSSANWNNVVTEIYPGQTAYLRVTDFDQNSIASAVETVTITIVTDGGDSETLTLTETGPNTGVFRAAISTTSGAVSAGNGTLQLNPVENATAVYIDGADADLNINQTRTAIVLVKPMTDLALTKTVSNPTPYANYTVVYTLKVKNNGPSYSSGAQVYDLLPAGVTYVSDDSGGQYNDTTGIWYVPVLFVNSSSILRIRATVDGTPTTVTNFANITSASQPDPVSSNDSSSATFAIGGVDLRLTKTVVGSNAPPAGGAATFLLTLTNLGMAAATSIKVTDHLPAFLTYSSHAASSGTYSSGTGIWNLPSLSYPGSATLTLYTKVSAGAGGQTITNFANISSVTQPDPASGNNSGSASLYVGGTDVAVSKTVTNPPTKNPKVGDRVTWTITASNIGTAAATNLRINDVLPSGVTFSTYSATSGTFKNTSGIWRIATLSASATATIKIRATVNSGTAGQTITNTATRYSMTQIDTNSANDSSSDSFTVQAADISITKTVNKASANAGDPIYYTLTAANSGPSTATNLRINDLLPAGIKFSRYSTTGGGGVYKNISGIWRVPSIANGSSKVLTIFANVTTNITTSQTFYNTAIYAGGDQTDPVVTNNSDMASVVVFAADIAVYKSVSNTSPAIGSTINYKVRVINNGPSQATNLIVSDILPSAFGYVGYAASQGTYSRTGSNANKWLVGTVLNNYSANITFTMTVAGTAGQTVTNTANKQSADQGDPVNTNNSASVSLVIGSTDLSVSKFVNYTAATLGTTLVYTVNVSNLGSNPANSVKIQDQTPSGVTYVSYSSSQGTFKNASSFWYAGTVAAGATATLKLRATVNSTSCGWPITNTASLYSVAVADPNSSNNSASVTSHIRCSDLQILKIADDTTPDEGEPFTYTISLTNLGPHGNTGVKVSDLLDTDLAFLSYSSTKGTFKNTSGIWNIGSLSALQTVYLYIRAEADVGTGGTDIPNTAAVSSATLSDPTAANNSSTVIITPTELPIITMTKLTQGFVDPFGGGYSIPGATYEYKLTVSNTGGGTASSIAITDPIPAKTVLYVNNLGGPGSGPLIFTDGSTPSGLTFTFSSYSSTSDSVEFRDGGGSPITPVPDANGYDSAVREIRINMGGTMSGFSGTPPPPLFELRFKVRIE